MSYFDPKIYNKQNLKSEDLKELEFYNDMFTSVIDNVRFEGDLLDSKCPTIDKIYSEIVEQTCEHLKERLGYAMQDLLVGIIDGYEEDHEVSEVEDYNTFLYESKEDETNE